MIGKDKIATAVRKKGEIIVKTRPFSRKTMKIPIIRGIVFLLSFMVIGIKELSWSANQQQEEEEELTTGEITMTILISFAAAAALFVILPYVIGKLITKGIMFNVIDGLLRLVFFIAYLIIIGRAQDIRTVFQYHGAEHKAVNCHENGEKTTTENAMKYSVRHPRCGTTLIVFVAILATAIFSLIRGPWYYAIIGRILFIPIIAGISYEALHWSADHQQNIISKLIITPGLWVQSLTTREPTKAQVEVAVRALNEVL